jgi:hypothetical protein
MNVRTPSHVPTVCTHTNTLCVLCSKKWAHKRNREAARGRCQGQLFRSRDAAVHASPLGSKQRSCGHHSEACRAGRQVCVPVEHDPSLPSPALLRALRPCSCASGLPSVAHAPTRPLTIPHAHMPSLHTHTHTSCTRTCTRTCTQCASDESTRMDSAPPCSQLGVYRLCKKAARLGRRPLRAVGEWENAHGGVLGSRFQGLRFGPLVFRVWDLVFRLRQV